MNGSSFHRTLHVSALFALAVAQPLFDLLGRNPEFFVARGSPPVDLLALAAGLCLGAPALIFAVEWVAARLSSTGARFVHLALIALFASALGLLVTQRLSSGPTALALGTLGGLLLTAAYARVPAVQTFLSVLAPAPLVILALFASRPGIFGLLRGEGPASVARVQVGKPAPVILVVFDELGGLSLVDENHEVDALRYPAFGRLAGTSTWFRNATGVAFRSELAVPAILTGRYPNGPRPQHFDEYPQNLFTLLGGTYRIIAYETLTRLCPKDVCGAVREPPPFGERIEVLFADAAVVYGHILLPDPFDGWLPPIGDRWGGFAVDDPAEAIHTPRPAVEELSPNPVWRRPKGALERKLPTIQEALGVDRERLVQRFIASIAASQTPTLYFLHIPVPHTPWRLLPSGRDYGSAEQNHLDGIGKAGVWSRDEWAVTQGMQRHLLQVGYVDHMLARLFARLEELGLFDEALIVITADHGMSSLPGEPRRSPGERGYPELLSVPLFVKAPGQKEAVVTDRNVESIDVVPTIADVLGVELPWPVEGSSALSGTAERPMKRFALDQGFNTYDGTFAEKEWNLRRLLDTFGSGRTRPAGVYAIGPYWQLVGQPLPADIEVRPGLGIRLETRQLANVHLDTRVPSRIHGMIASSDSVTSRHIAIAVNGEIAAVTQTLAAGKQSRFTAMLLESALRDGRNTAEALLVEESEGQVRLYRGDEESLAKPFPLR